MMLSVASNEYDSSNTDARVLSNPYHTPCISDFLWRNVMLYLGTVRSIAKSVVVSLGIASATT